MSLSTEHHIPWLEFLENKLISDHRGYLGEIVPGGIVHPFLWGKLGHIYASVATGKHIARGGHYHGKNIDRFCTLSGSALWIFVDYRNPEHTAFAIILGEKEFKNDFSIKNYTIDLGYMVTASVPVGVYHIFIPLTDERVTVLSLASEVHDDDDYVRIKPQDIPEIHTLLHNLGIQW